MHAGIDESTGSMWEWETSDDIYTSKYPAETGKIDGLDMKVVAEGVETKEQADCLKEYGCDYLQGFYFSKPLPEEEFAKLLD